MKTVREAAEQMAADAIAVLEAEINGASAVTILNREVAHDLLTTAFEVVMEVTAEKCLSSK